ncbi:MAG TPA: menaquinone biosynthesis decarboxylase [Bacteroidales bacterium]|nr:menaquinone biosynthesis decarboxylase [Bacteroidales bacterium]
MAFNGLKDFIIFLKKRDQLVVIESKVNPELEIAEIADRVFKTGGKALLFTNNGTCFSLIINMFGSEERMSYSIGRTDLEEAGKEIESLFRSFTNLKNGILPKIGLLPKVLALAKLTPKRQKIKGKCQEIIMDEPDLDLFPVMKCWPHDGGRFITLPIVHTIHPDSGEPNAGMYRMQIFDKRSTGMHWHRHKTGANHYDAWKIKGLKMPVSVALGGDPVYTYAATAPLPEGIDEYLLAGFLRKKRVRLVKCLTNDIYIPEDADIVLEGYVDTAEELHWEGPFGDHTGYYSLADWYPKFHITCITHRRDAVYPSTIVGVPPQEDSWIGLATERLFLYPIRLTIQPEIADIHVPSFGVAHNLVLVSIEKKYPGQGMKVINSLFGAGQMMLSKFIIVFEKEVKLTDYDQVLSAIFNNVDPDTDLLFTSGPLDVLDHSSGKYSSGGKLGIDATAELTVGNHKSDNKLIIEKISDVSILSRLKSSGIIRKIDASLTKNGIPVLFMTVNKDYEWKSGLRESLQRFTGAWIIIMDAWHDELGGFFTAWQILSNTDPVRDIEICNGNILIDSTSKTHRSDRFERKWPNVVGSDQNTIMQVDRRWEELNLGEFIKSPTHLISCLIQPGDAEVNKEG